MQNMRTDYLLDANYWSECFFLWCHVRTDKAEVKSGRLTVITSMARQIMIRSQSRRK